MGRPLSGYMLWFKDTRKTIKGKNIVEVSKKAGEMWKGLAADKKKSYGDRAEEAKKKYAAYIASGKGAAALKAYKEGVAKAKAPLKAKDEKAKAKKAAAKVKAKARAAAKKEKLKALKDKKKVKAVAAKAAKAAKKKKVQAAKAAKKQKKKRLESGVATAAFTFSTTSSYLANFLPSSSVWPRPTHTFLVMLRPRAYMTSPRKKRSISPLPSQS